MSAPRTDGVRLAELVASLSYAADLGLGQPMAHCMRQTVIALRLADLTGASDAEREATYYLGLMFNAFCHADATEQASWFGDDIGFKSEAFDMLGMTTAQTAGFVIRRVGGHGSGLSRARRLAGFPHSSVKRVMDFLATHARLAAQFAEQIGLEEIAVQAFRDGYEQWDGKGVPRGLRGPEIPLPARLVQFAAPIEVFERRHGRQAARDAARRHRGADFDPVVVDIFRAHESEILDDLDQASEWAALVDGERYLSRWVCGPELEAVLESMADLADLKSPQFAGHSRGVADLAAAAGRLSGLPDADVTILRRAGLLHGLGRLGVTNRIWDRPASLSSGETEHVRFHPYFTERMLAHVPALAASREVAARHQERLDGSGYPRGLSAAALTPLDRLLAAADVCHAMSEPRPYRDALTPDAIAVELTREVRDGRLDGDAVAAVLSASGRRRTRRRGWPSGLSAREVEVLSLLARGRSNRQIADRLGITPKTAANHIAHIYTKIDVSSRAAATLFASRHGLVGAFENETARDHSARRHRLRGNRLVAPRRAGTLWSHPPLDPEEVAVADEMPPLSGTHHVALTVTDLEASLAWYRDVLGFEHVPQLDYDHPDGGGRGAVTVQPGSNTVLVLHHHDANDGERFAESRTGLDHVSFRVPDREAIESWQRRLERLGVEHSGVAEQSGALFLVFRDPDHIQLELGTAD